jgi:VWFA-related protein
MNRRFLTFAVCAALAVPSLAPAQKAPPADAPPIFGEEIDVRVVNVEAVVTDHAGNRVSDLKPGEFELRVDGKAVPISFFTEVREGRSMPAAREGVAGEAPQPARVEPGEAVSTSYLVFVDDYFSTAVRRNEVLQALKKDVSRLGPHDTMAIMTFDGARLAKLCAWTRSGDALSAAFDRAMAQPARGLDRASEHRSFVDSQSFSDHIRDDEPGNPTKRAEGPKDPVNRMLATSLSMQESAYGETLVRQVRDAVSAAVSAMRGAGAPGGRKVMLLLSGGWPYSIQGFLRGAGSVPPSHELSDGEQIFRPLTSTANLLGFTLYPVDVPGIESAAADASSFGPQAAGGGLREQEVEGTLSFLAQETGGRALLNSARGAALSTATEDVRTYYWLGFTPTWERNDRRHTVEVTVHRAGLKVRSRNSFLDLSRKAEVSMRLESALFLGSLPEAVPMPMKLGAPATVKGLTEIPVTLGLPVKAMSILPADGRYRAHLELRVAAADENGNRSEVPVVPIDLAATSAPKGDGFVRYDTRIKFKGKAKHLVVATYDPLSGKIATAEADVNP